MTLTRRTPLTASKPLTRAPFLRRRPKDRAPKRRRDTGPDRRTRELVHQRSRHCCERCGADLTRTPVGRSVHHRRRRGMGGTTNPAINSPANLLDLCGTGTTGCHGWIETHRTEATAAGWLVPHGVDPAEWPVQVASFFGQPVWVYLTHDGDHVIKEFG